MTHGDYQDYNRGCRCDDCRRAWNVYQQQLIARHQRETVSVPRAKVRRHLETILAVGATANGIAKAAGVRPESVRRVLDPDATRPVPVRCATKLLATTPDDLPDTALVDGRYAWELLDRLDTAGVPRYRIATEALGWENWPGRDYPHGRVRLGLVRTLRRYLDDVTRPRCDDCGAPPLAEGRWCLPCLRNRSTRNRNRKAVCGNDAGYAAHLRRGETPCPACREAHAQANRRRRESAA